MSDQGVSVILSVPASRVEVLPSLSVEERSLLVDWLVDEMMSGVGEGNVLWGRLHNKLGMGKREFDSLMQSSEFRDRLWQRLGTEVLLPAWLRSKITQSKMAMGGNLEAARQMWKREYEGGEIKLTQSVEGDMAALRDFLRSEATGQGEG